jgi:hypothetical protein
MAVACTAAASPLARSMSNARLEASRPVSLDQKVFSMVTGHDPS